MLVWASKAKIPAWPGQGFRGYRRQDELIGTRSEPAAARFSVGSWAHFVRSRPESLLPVVVLSSRDAERNFSSGFSLLTTWPGDRTTRIQTSSGSSGPASLGGLTCTLAGNCLGKAQLFPGEKVRCPADCYLGSTQVHSRHR